MTINKVFVIVVICAVAFTFLSGCKDDQQEAVLPDQNADAYSNFNYLNYPGTPNRHRVLTTFRTTFFDSTVGKNVLYGHYLEEPHYNHYFCAFDLVTGKEKWRYELASETPSAQPVLTESTVILPNGSTLIALNRETGRQIWQNGGLKMSANECTLALHDGTLYLALNSGIIYGFDPVNGEVLSINMLPLANISRIVITGEKLLVATTNDIVALAFPSCEPIWLNPEAPSEYPENRWLYVYDDFDCLFYENDHELRCVALIDGTVKWALDRITLSELGCCRLIGVARESVFIGAIDGTIRGYDINSGRQNWEMILPYEAGAVREFTFRDSICLPDYIYVAASIIGNTDGEPYQEYEEHLWVINLDTREIAWQIDNCFGIEQIYDQISIVNIAGRCAVIGPVEFLKEKAWKDSILNNYPASFDYLETCYLMGAHYWSDLRKMLEEILDKYPPETQYAAYVDGTYENFQAAPYLLEMLGVIYRSEGHMSRAMDCFQTMIAQHREAVYFPRRDARLRYALQAGYERQIETQRDFEHDYEAALQLIHTFLADGGPFTEEILDQLHRTLIVAGAPLSRWKSEYQRFADQIVETDYQAEAFFDLAFVLLENNSTKDAESLLEKIAIEYRDASILFEGHFWSPALSARQLLLAIAELQRMGSPEIESRRAAMVGLYDYLIAKWQAYPDVSLYRYWERCPEEIRNIFMKYQDSFADIF